MQLLNSIKIFLICLWEFDAVSNFMAHLSFIIKGNTIENKKMREIEEEMLAKKIPTPNNGNWWEEDIFSKTDTQPTTDATKIIVGDIKQTTNDVLKDIDIQAISDNILRNLRPVDNKNAQEQAEDDFISTGDRTQQELEDDDFLSIASDNKSETGVVLHQIVKLKLIWSNLNLLIQHLPGTKIKQISKTWSNNKTFNWLW